MNFTSITQGIQEVVEREEQILQNLSNEIILAKRNKQDRTVKQILGHLIDSASNNHQRMVRLQYIDTQLDFPDYRQDNDRWISIQRYQSADWNNLIQLWKFYNLHIIHIINTVNISTLANYWHDFEGAKVTLKDMIEGYLSHLHLHINEIHELIEQR